MPHGLSDPLRQPITPDFYVDTTAVIDTKLAALAAHKCQQGWLAATQGMNSYLEAMLEMSREIGRRSSAFEHAEAWRRHLHYGFSQTEIDPLRQIVGAP